MGTERRLAIWVELIAIIAASVLVYALAVSVELSEQIASRLRPLEAWQVDEIPHGLLTLSIGLGWFSYRRLIESRRDLGLRVAAQREAEQLLQQNQLLLEQLFAVQENERRELARELHDELGQCLTAIKVDATTIRSRTLGGDRVSHDCAQAIVTTAEHVYDVVRSVLKRLRPDTLDALGLTAALQTQLDGWRQRHSIGCELVIEGMLDNCGESLSIALYRLVQEGLTNIAKHANARHAKIQLVRKCASASRVGHRHGAADVIELRIDDDGGGIAETEHSSRGLGILGMRERVRAMGGVMTVSSSLVSGTRVHIEIPIEGTADHATA